MIVICPSCESRFQMPQEHLARPGVRFRCTTCRYVFALNEVPQAATQPIAPAPSRIPRPDPNESVLPAGGGFDARRSQVSRDTPAVDPIWGTAKAGPASTSSSASTSSFGTHPEQRSVGFGTLVDSGAHPTTPRPSVGARSSEVNANRGRPAFGAADSDVSPAPGRVSPPSIVQPPVSNSGLRSAPRPPPSKSPLSVAQSPVSQPRRATAAAMPAGVKQAPLTHTMNALSSPEQAANQMFSASVSLDSNLPLSGSADFRVVEQVEDVPPVAGGGIDPLVEFNDLFQEIRREEQGDQRKASERYRPDAFGAPSAATPDEAQQLAARLAAPTPNTGSMIPVPQRVSVPETPTVQPELPNRAAAASAPPSPPSLFSAADAATKPVRNTNDDSLLLDLALNTSGLREPSVQEKTAVPVIDMDASGDSRSRPMLFPKAARTLSVVLIILLCSVAVALFTAYKNRWVLDLAAPGHMLAVAFNGETYTPREVRVIRVEEGGESPIAVADLSAPPPNRLSARTVDAGVFVNSAGQRFVVIDGEVTNEASAHYRDVYVEVVLRSADGTVRDTLVVPAGARLETPALEASADGRLEAAYEALGTTTRALRLEPGQQTVFTAALPIGPQDSVDAMTHSAHVTRAERERPAMWETVTFRPEHVAIQDQRP